MIIALAIIIARSSMTDHFYCLFPHTPVSITIVPQSGIFLGGTSVRIAGACLEPTDNITCMFDGIEVSGLVMSSLVALCVSPRFNEIGKVNLHLLVRSANGILRSQGTKEFISGIIIYYLIVGRDIFTVTIRSSSGNDIFTDTYYIPQSTTC